jgi:DNA-binding HxlR family transcriptional regulator
MITGIGVHDPPEFAFTINWNRCSRSTGFSVHDPPEHAQLLPHLGMFSPTRLSRHLRQLLDLGVIKRVTGTYRYYLTKAGRAATAAAERITEAVIVPAMIRWDLTDGAIQRSRREELARKGLLTFFWYSNETAPIAAR